MKVEWYYENQQSVFYMNQEELSSSRLYQYLNQSLKGSIQGIIKSLQEILNSPSFDILFYGQKKDYIILKEEIENKCDSQEISVKWIRHSKKQRAYEEIIKYMRDVIARNSVEEWKGNELQNDINDLEDLVTSIHSKDELLYVQANKIREFFVQTLKEDFKRTEESYNVKKVEEIQKFKELKEDYSSRAYKALEKHFIEVYLPIVDVCEIVASALASPKELLGKENVNTRFQVLISENENNKSMENKEPYENFRVLVKKIEEIIEEEVIKTEEKPSLFPSRNRNLFYSEKQYNYVVDYHLTLLSILEDFLLIKSEEEGPFQEAISTQFHFIQNVIKNIKEDKKRIAFASAEKIKGKDLLFEKQLVDEYFNDVNERLQNQIENWLDHQFITDNDFKQYWLEHFEKTRDGEFILKQKQYENNLAALEEQLGIKLESYQQNNEDLLKLQEMLEEVKV